MGLPGQTATLAQLRALPLETVVAASPEIVSPAIDGRLIRQSTAAAFAKGEQAPIPLIIGSNSNEASLMRAFGMKPAEAVARASPALRAAYGAEADTEDTFARLLFNDGFMGAPARWIAAKASAKAPAWLYYFSYVPERQRATRPGPTTPRKSPSCSS